MNTKEFGKYGEDKACEYLRSRGYEILARNYSKKWLSGPIRAEIDIIARKDKTICFIEVKSARNADVFLPEARVNFGKQRKIAKLAEIWLSENKVSLESRWQIDVISFNASNKEKIKHFKNCVPA